MTPDPQDTIVALSSAPGPGARAIVRVSGPAALRIALSAFCPAEPIEPTRRRRYAGQIHLLGLSASLSGDLCFWPGRRTYTGQELVEIHTLSSPPLTELLIAQLLNAGARAAQPGEFTLRGFLAGKLDLTQAEAVRGVIEAGNRDQLKQALAQLAGGVALPLQQLRDELLNLLADVEAGLDFTEEDIHFIARDELLQRIGKSLAHLVLLQKQFDQRAASNKLFRAVLVGRPNTGKSSLFNALAPGSAALVGPEAGTTRDYLVRRLEVAGVTLEVVDTAGWQPAAGSIQEQAQRLSREQADQADLLLLCLESGQAAAV